MKHLFLISLLVILATTNGFTQTEKGNFLIGGNVNFTTSGPNSTRSTHFIINPSFGYFIKNNLAIGADISYSYQNYNLYNSFPPVNYHRIDNNYGISPFVRYYKSLNEKLALFGIGNIGISYTQTHFKDPSLSPYDQLGIGATLKPGLAYFLSKKFGLELTAGSISYNTNLINNNHSQYSSNGDNFVFGFGLRSLLLGAYFYL